VNDDMVRAAAALVITTGATLAVVVLFGSGDDSADETRTPAPATSSFCLSDETGMRVFERPFPQGGEVDLFSVTYTGNLPVTNPYYCHDRNAT
jgi:hypothetical protein